MTAQGNKGTTPGAPTMRDLVPGKLIAALGATPPDAPRMRESHSLTAGARPFDDLNRDAAPSKRGAERSVGRKALTIIGRTRSRPGPDRPTDAAGERSCVAQHRCGTRAALACAARGARAGRGSEAPVPTIDTRSLCASQRPDWHPGEDSPADIPQGERRTRPERIRSCTWTS